VIWLKRIRTIGIITFFVALIILAIGGFLVYQEVINYKPKIEIINTNKNNMSANANMIVKDVEDSDGNKMINYRLEEVQMEVVPDSVYIPPRVEVYEGLTLQELSEKLNRHLGNDVIAGKGELIAAECLNRGVDPYIMVAIILQETGCGSHCSNLARNCNNFGGIKGKPSCNGGSFKQFDSVDEGLVGMIDVLSRNYFQLGLNTPETIGPKYCEGNEWAGKVSWFVNKIRNN